MRLALQSLLVVFALCAVPSAQTSDVLPRRLVVGLDGLGYEDMIAAQSAGAFHEFFPVSRLVSTFPSTSDIAWSEIFHTSPPPGYQRVYFRLDAGKTVGGPLASISPIEFEKRMQLGFDQKAHHLASYMAPNRVSRGELTTLAQAFFQSHGVDTFYAYLPAPDALQHVRGDVAKYLQALDVQLTHLLRSYHARTGQDLELVLVSDHGFNKALHPRMIDLRQFLKKHGYNPGDKIDGPKDVVFNTDGVTTGVGVFAPASDVPSLAEVLSTLEGVELVTWVPAAAPADVLVRDGDGAVARIRRRPTGELSYETMTGDPLHYAGLAQRLAGTGRMDDAGFAAPLAWFDVSRDHEFPAALERILRGHHDVTQNPAPILVSMRDGYQLANGLVAFLNRLRPTGGAHGGLNAINSVGIVMSNYRPTVDAQSFDVATQFDGFATLPATPGRSRRAVNERRSTAAGAPPSRRTRPQQSRRAPVPPAQ